MTLLTEKIAEENPPAAQQVHFSAVSETVESPRFVAVHRVVSNISLRINEVISHSSGSTSPYPVGCCQLIPIGFIDSSSYAHSISVIHIYAYYHHTGV